MPQFYPGLDKIDVEGDNDSVKATAYVDIIDAALKPVKYKVPNSAVTVDDNEATIDLEQVPVTDGEKDGTMASHLDLKEADFVKKNGQWMLEATSFVEN